MPAEGQNPPPQLSLWRLPRHAMRRRMFAILERDAVHDPTAQVVHTLLIALILGNTFAAVVETVPSIGVPYRAGLHVFELVSFVVFAAEYGLRLWAAPENPRFRGMRSGRARLSYAATPAAIIDLLAVMPFGLVLLLNADLRIFALFRLVRFMKLARYSPGIASLLEAIRLERHALLACLGIIAAVVLLAASVMYVVEHEAQPDKFGSIPLAAWWAVVTVTTVGYGDVVPITLAGRMVAGVTMITGLVMIALPVGIITSAFADVIRRREFVVSWGMVARVPLFAELDAAGIGEILRLLSSHTAEPGEVLMRRGDVARSMFFILSGEVQIELEAGPLRLGEGHFFGEMALRTGRLRSATVRALSRTQLLILEGKDFADLLARRPEIAGRIADLEHREEAPHSLRPRGDISPEELDEADRQPSSDA
ncbi:cyclic nucleotide-gated ion channel [Roseixanthobacter liquoris]|uniref:cyclic nucleotide-gated ion channel n=1 Tax=Roseixanthobacter liquoris TaxID=3119921 RepID=UPI00372B1139